jgi:alanine-synthesizing transaminase
VSVPQASRLNNVRYDIRGPVLRRARQLEAEGNFILKLNIGNTAPFGLHAPDSVVHEVVRNITDAQGYSDARGIHSARLAVAQHYNTLGVPGVSPDDVFLGNGVSELIVMALQALLDPGDEVLVPSPDYPLWTGAVILCGARAAHYRCDESAGWQPDLDHVRSQINENTRALVIINPNNPTGAVYSRQTLLGLLDLAREHNLLVLADEIYDKILYDGAEHCPAATLAPDLMVLTLSGLSKTYRAPGFRTGWLVVSGPRRDAAGYLEGLELLANMRMCPNVPSQFAIQAALGGPQSITALLQPGGRLRDQRDFAWQQLNDIPGVDCVKPAGALYVFPRLDPDVYKISDDQQLVIDLLEQQHLLLTHGTGFNLDTPDHLRMVFLAGVDVLGDAIGRLATFLADYQQ